MILYLGKSWHMGGHIVMSCVCVMVIHKCRLFDVMSVINLYPRLNGYNGPVTSS